MPVTSHIPGALLEFTAGRSRVEIADSPATLAEALSALWTLYPGVRDRVTTEQGQVRLNKFKRWLGAGTVISSREQEGGRDHSGHLPNVVARFS
jgi:hypothetical protein